MSTAPPSTDALPTDAPILYLIDGHAQMFRAYHAIRGGMTSPVTGEPTNATFAFTGLLLKLFAQYKPQYVAMTIDSKGDTFRHEFYPEYKGTRSAPPEDFIPQIPTMLDTARMLGIPVLEKPGDEADDLMATLALKLAERHPNLHIRLVAKDKDLEQTLTDRVTLFDAHTNVELTVAGLMEKRGITPSQVIDYQTLIGDSTDNIPGVKGIGPKTARTLLEKFGSVQELTGRLNELKGKQKENLETAAADGSIELTRRLVTLKTDSDIDLTLEDAAVTPDAFDTEKLDALFERLGFNRHRADLRALTQPAAATPAAVTPKKTNRPEAGAGGLFDQEGDQGESDSISAIDPLEGLVGDYTAITTTAQLKELVATLKKQTLIAVDTETIGLGATSELCGICLAWKTGEAVYVPMRSPDPDAHLSPEQVLEGLRPVLEDAALPKVGHNIKYDWLVLHHAGITLAGMAFDTMVAAFLCGAPGLKMDHLALAELGRTTVPINALIGEKPRRKADPPQKTMDQIPLSLITGYAAEDADVTLQLHAVFAPRLKQMGMSSLAADVEMPLVEVLSTMESHGITVNPQELERQREGLQAKIDVLRQQILEAAQTDFNPDSPKQLGELLFTTLGFPTQRKTKTGFSTDAETLDKLAALPDGDLLDVPQHARPLPKLIVEYRMLTKLVGTYLVALVKAIRESDGRVHASFHQTGAATGRLSSSNPNLQNIPIRTPTGREIRRAFIAAPGHVLVSADYSQIELRVLAHLSQDAALIDAFQRDQDIHTAVAAHVYNMPLKEVSKDQRNHAKTINFGIIYGVTAFGLSRRIEGLDMAGATHLIEEYKAGYPGIDTFMESCVDQALKEGYVTTLLGRRRTIEQVHARNPNQRSLGERLAINSVVQGSAADLIKLAMVNLHRRIERDNVPAKILLQIHDELVLECPEAHADTVSALLIEEMQNAMTLRVPLKVDPSVGNNWFETK
ncbi:MAG: DNA polymerase I [Algisphaera sp.]